MTKKLAEMDWKEHEELAALLEPWLGQYRKEIIDHAINQMDDILANDTAMMMIRELGIRAEKERKDRKQSILFAFRNIAENDMDGYKIHMEAIHNHCLEHSESYRNVLYDMYLSNWTGRKGETK